MSVRSWLNNCYIVQPNVFLVANKANENISLSKYGVSII